MIQAAWRLFIGLMFSKSCTQWDLIWSAAATVLAITGDWGWWALLCVCAIIIGRMGQYKRTQYIDAAKLRKQDNENGSGPR